MIPNIVEICVGGVFVALWLATAVLPISRVSAMRQDKDHPFAAPLCTLKVILLVILGVWAMCYASIGEFGLFLPGTIWRFIPEFTFYALGRHTLRQSAILIYCIVVSTPGAVFPVRPSTKVSGDEHDNDNAELDGLYGREEAALFSNHDRRTKGTGSLPRSASFCVHHVSYEGDHGHVRLGVSPSGNRDLYSVQPSFTWREGGSVVQNDVCPHLRVSSPLSYIGNFMDSCSTPLSMRFDDADPHQTLGGLHNSRANADTSVVFPTRYADPELNGAGPCTLSVRECSAPPQSLSDRVPTTVYVVDAAGNHASFTTEKTRSTFARKWSFVIGWLAGHPFPAIGVNSETTSDGDGCDCIFYNWKCLVLWGAVLQLRFVVVFWLVSVPPVIYLSALALLEDLQDCHEHISEIAICWVEHKLAPTRRLHPPRSFTMIFLLSDVILLCVWMMCGVRCLECIGNVLAKERFRRTYYMGAVLIALSIIYSCFSIFDPLRYNEIVTVTLLIFRNVCDILMVLLLTVQLGSPNGQKPRWLVWLRGTGGELNKETTSAPE